MMIKRKRGRPKLFRVKIDKGTPELQKKKLELLKPGQEQTLTESLLGILYGRDIISTSQYDAGLTLREIGYKYEACLNYTLKMTKSMLAHKTGTQLTESQVVARTKSWRRALLALKGSGHRSYIIVLKVVFYDGEVRTVPRDAHYIEELRFGLNGLSRYFTGDGKVQRDKFCDQDSILEKATTVPMFSKGAQHPFPPLYPPQADHYR